MTTKFTVHGPLSVPTAKTKIGKLIDSDSARRFWERYPDTADLCGCYVFAMSAAGGLTPGYVGKATRSFKGEVFQPHKLTKYHQVLSDYLRGQPVLFFVVAPAPKGKPNTRHIAQVEKYLIRRAADVNPDLANIKHTKEPNWSIAGVVRSGQGNSSDAAKKLKRALKL